jgi:hypothetical protein
VTLQAAQQEAEWVTHEWKEPAVIFFDAQRQSYDTVPLSFFEERKMEERYRVVKIVQPREETDIG